MTNTTSKTVSGSHIEGEMEFQLKNPIKYSDNGSQVESTFLTCYESRGEHAKTMRKVAFVVDSVLISLGKNAATKSTPTPTAVQKEFDEVGEDEFSDGVESMSEMLTVAFAMSGDMEKSELFMDCFERAVTTQTRHPLIKVQGNYAFRDVHWEQLDYQEQKKLAVAYVSFFGIGYLGDMMKK
jgi:hypothetical protein